MKILAYASHSGRYFPAFLHSCYRYNIEPVVLGWNETYYHGGHITKIKYVHNYLRDINDEEIILFMDGFDVIVTASEEEIKTKYESLGSPSLLFNAETHCNPHPFLYWRYPVCDTPYQYLNAGCYIGKCWALKQIFKESNLAIIPNEKDDQDFFTTYYLTQTNNLITLDHKTQIFMALYDTPGHIDYKTGINIFTGNIPLIWHGNGNENMIPVIDYAETLRNYEDGS